MQNRVIPNRTDWNLDRDTSSFVVTPKGLGQKKILFYYALPCQQVWI